jgi:anti-sigma factor RsiW
MEGIGANAGEGKDKMNLVSRPCPDRELLLHGLADNELDPANALALEEHIRTCRECAAAFDDIVLQKQLLKSKALNSRVSPELRERVLGALAAEEVAKQGREIPPSMQPAAPNDNSRRTLPARLGIGASALALAASLFLFVSIWSSQPKPQLDEELAANHVRSLLASHLTDVASSDQHTVKPWFLGRLDFAPPVVDLASRDFALVGGRLDYLRGRVAPALVYKRRGHVINLFIWPGSKNETVAQTRDGYNIVSWTQSGFDFAAISDLNPAELSEFRSAMQNSLR